MKANPTPPTKLTRAISTESRDEFAHSGGLELAIYFERAGEALITDTIHLH